MITITRPITINDQPTDSTNSSTNPMIRWSTNNYLSILTVLRSTADNRSGSNTVSVSLFRPHQLSFP